MNETIEIKILPNAKGEVKFGFYAKEANIEWGKSIIEKFKFSKEKEMKCEHKYINAKEVKTIIIKGKNIGSFYNIGKYSSMEIKFKNCNSLDHLFIINAGLKTLDVTKLPKLYWLDCTKNKLKSLDVSNNKSLDTLHCDNNLLTKLDVSKLPKLIALRCNDNKLKELIIPKILPNILCRNNELAKLDLSKIKHIGNLYCEGNKFKDGSVLINEKAVAKTSLFNPDRTSKIYKIVK